MKQCACWIPKISPLNKSGPSWNGPRETWLSSTEGLIVLCTASLHVMKPGFISNDPETNRQSAKWVFPGNGSLVKDKRSRRVGKVMCAHSLTCLATSFLFHWKISALSLPTVLQLFVFPSCGRKRPISGIKSFILHTDNGSAHSGETAHIWQWTFWWNKCWDKWAIFLTVQTWPFATYVCSKRQKKSLVERGFRVLKLLWESISAPYRVGLWRPMLEPIKSGSGGWNFVWIVLRGALKNCKIFIKK